MIPHLARLDLAIIGQYPLYGQIDTQCRRGYNKD